MKKLFYTLIIILITFTLSSCAISIDFSNSLDDDSNDDTSDVIFDHICTEVIDEAVEPTCTESGLTEGSHCSICGKVIVAQEVIEPLGHTKVIDLDAVEATCTHSGKTEGSHCSVCGEILSVSEEIEKEEHTVVIDEAVPATSVSTGLTEGSHCSVCGEILVAQTVIPKLVYDTYDYSSSDIPYKLEYNSETSDYNIYYNDILLDDYISTYSSSHMFDSFDDLDNGDDMKIAYLEALSKALIVTLYYDSSFSKSVIEGNAYYKAFSIPFNSSDYTIKEDEAKTVWTAVKSDNPMLYWIDTTVLTGSSDLYFIIEDDYLDYDFRYNAFVDITNKIDTITNNIRSLSDSNKIEYIYDYIIDNTDYAWVDGVASTDISAHNIYGFFNSKNVVCEGYAKTLQILLNASNIDNHLIFGYAENNENYGHAWNYIMKNNKWYFTDVTWDDDGDSDYNYYMLNKIKVSLLTGTKAHTPYSNKLGIKYMYELPELASI